VNNISVMMFTRMGVPNGEMAFFTSLLYLPWTIKPFWSPFVDIVRTKRWWILAMQLLMSAAFVLLTLTLPHPDAALIANKEVHVSMFTITLLLFIITAFASATHDIAADGFYMLATTHDEQSFFVGIRSTFYRLSSIFGQGVLVYIAGHLEQTTGNIPLAWQLTLGLCAVIFSVLTLYHTWAIPHPDADGPRRHEGARSSSQEIVYEFGRTWATYFRKPGVLLAIVFMLLYRLPEAFLIKMINPFLVDPAEKGGLALATEDVGIVYGTIGVIALTVGGILGGIAASRWGLRKSLWPMAACMTLPCATFVYLSMAHPTSLVVVALCVAVEQFGYGFGFTAYMLYMMYFSEGESVTAHYAICTGFMALSMMLPGMIAGELQEALGYELFFWMVMICCLATVAVTLLVSRRVDEHYGKKEVEQS
jgi:PAT family beta-lactamase induction signal transducer AmpG